MKAACFFGNRDIRVEDLPEPTIMEPTDALGRVTLSSVCGSDLHYYRSGEELGFPAGMRTGHEAAGTVEAVGREVTEFAPGDRVLVYPVPTDGTRRYCRDDAWPCEAGAGAFGFTHTLPLDQAAEGYRLMDERVDGVIKVALSPGG
jgi:threonine dehydrogenase-like Zn-dependent dehydrogenase